MASLGDSVELTSDRLTRWWAEPFSAKAVLILDGLSLRELPWLLQGAKERGFTTHEVTACASELPGETDEFARALGFASRSKLQNNGGGLAHKLQAANTETVDLPWKDCEALINSAPNQIFWHHWPDAKLHDGSGAGQGLEPLTKDVAEQLSSDDFWAFVERLATGGGWSSPPITAMRPLATSPMPMARSASFSSRRLEARAARLESATPAPSCRRWHCRSTALTARTCWP